LAGALHAIELLKAMRERFAGESLGTFAAEVLADVEADRKVRAKLTECVGGVPRQRRQRRICLHAIDPEAAPRRFLTISADQPSGLRSQDKVAINCNLALGLS
jgi:hypothetical protein